MTHQVGETLMVDGAPYSIRELPLERWIRAVGFPHELDWSCSALWRGYLGTWEIRDGMLLLIDISYLHDRTVWLSLEACFPGYPKGVLAHWFTGTLTAGSFATIQKIRQLYPGWTHDAESDLRISISRGKVVSLEVIPEDEEDVPA